MSSRIVFDEARKIWSVRTTSNARLGKDSRLRKALITTFVSITTLNLGIFKKGS